MTDKESPDVSQDVAVEQQDTSDINNPPQVIPAEASASPNIPPTVEALTPERRQQIKAMLLEKQRQARNVASPSLPSDTSLTPSSTTSDVSKETTVHQKDLDTNTSIPADEDRSSLIQSAIRFLSSPNVQSASHERQNEFLTSKGLTDQEIERARQKVTLSCVSSQPSLNPPPVPPRIYPTHSLVTFPSSNLHTSSPQHIIKIIAMIIALVSASSVGLWCVFKTRLQTSFASFLDKYTRFIEQRQLQVATIMETIYHFCKYYTIPSPDETTNVPHAVSQSILETQEKVDSLQQAMTSLKKRIVEFDPLDASNIKPDSDIIVLKQSVDQLSQLITRHTYFSPSFSTLTSTAGVEESESSQKWAKAVEEVRNEIRSIKGMLLSKKNFPGVAPAAPQ